MTFFILLPVAVLTLCMASWIEQSIREAFVDLRVLASVATLTLAAWSLAGWHLEAQAGRRVADVATACLVEAEGRLNHTEDLVASALVGDLR